ncbi:exo-alpha-sialidase, partial [bacterium]
MNNEITKSRQSVSTTVKTAFYWLLLIGSISTTRAADPPFTVKNGLFDHSQPDHLGLSTAQGTETISVFQPSDSTDHFSNGAVMVVFKDYFYCQWQSSAKDEDAQDTWVAYSRSQDGKTWTAPMTLAPTIENGYRSSGGWWVAGDTLVAYLNVWPSSVSPRGGYTSYTTSTDGLTWSEIKPLLMANGDTLSGIFEQDPHVLPDGRIINAAHFQPGINVCPIYTDDPLGISGWIKANFTNLGTGSVSREIEPSWYLRKDGIIVMTFRDQNGTYHRLASVSSDRGESWTTPVLTDMPDSRSKQSAGNLPDSTAYLVGNPANNKTRIPLAVTLGKDGKFFNTAYLLRQGGEGIQELRYSGTAKRLGFHYPKSMVWQDYLYVSYTTNKEDVEYTRVPLASLILDTSTTAIHSSFSEDLKEFSLSQNYPNPFNSTTSINYQIFKPDIYEFSIYNVKGEILKKLFKKYHNN